jgi:hypothetical protein
MHMQEGTMDVAKENLLKVMRWGRHVVAQDVVAQALRAWAG